jgi:hypothetical protein
MTPSSSIRARFPTRAAHKNILSAIEIGAAHDPQKILISSNVFESPFALHRGGGGLAIDAAKRCRGRLQMRDQATRSRELRTQNDGVTVFFIALV